MTLKFGKRDSTMFTGLRHSKAICRNFLGSFFSSFAFQNNIILVKFDRIQPTRLSIFFKERQFLTLKRSELYGYTDFFAKCGGLLGLFMGISLLSIVELIYYCTLRLGCTFRMRRARKNRQRVAAAEAINVPGVMIDPAVEKKDHQN